MNYTARAGAAASPFASLLSGFGKSRAVKAAKADDEDMKSSASEDDDDEDEDDKDKKSKKAKAEDEDDDNKSKKAAAEDGDDEDEDKKSKSSKKAKAEDDDNEEGGDDYDAGRKAERGRWSAVLSSPAAADGRVAAACEMLSTTPMSAKSIIRTLNALPVTTEAAAGLRDRMAKVDQPKVGADGGKVPAAGSDDGFAAEMHAAVSAVRPGAQAPR